MGDCFDCMEDCAFILCFPFIYMAMWVGDILDCTRYICFNCKRRKGGCVCGQVGSRSCKQNATPLSSCLFHSPRIQGLHEGLRTELKTSKDHWSVVDSKSHVEEERVGVDSCKYFDEVLVKHEEWGAFFSKFENLELGEKIGEGGQAEILACTCTSQRHRKLVAKVSKKNVSLKDLERQWPCEVMIEVALGSPHTF